MHTDFEEQSKRPTAAEDRNKTGPSLGSPPPTPPTKKPWDTDLGFKYGKAYKEWQLRDAEHRKRPLERDKV